MSPKRGKGSSTMPRQLDKESLKKTTRDLEFTWAASRTGFPIPIFWKTCKRHPADRKPTHGPVATRFIPKRVWQFDPIKTKKDGAPEPIVHGQFAVKAVDRSTKRFPGLLAKPQPLLINSCITSSPKSRSSNYRTTTASSVLSSCTTESRSLSRPISTRTSKKRLLPSLN